MLKPGDLEDLSSGWNVPECLRAHDPARQCQDLIECVHMEPSGSAAGIGLFHASPRDPIWEYVLSIDQAEAGLDAQTERICLIGHSHVSLFFTRPPSTGRKTYATGAQATDGDLLDLGEGEWLLNPGSVGQPRDGDPRAAWLEIDTDDRTARYHRVEYDAVAAGAAILEAGLPSALAERLQIGR